MLYYRWDGVMNKNDILEKLSQEKEYIKNKFEVEKIGLFEIYVQMS